MTMKHQQLNLSQRYKEVDFIMGKNHQSALLVLVDRASLLTRIEKLKRKNADHIAQKIIKKLQ
jgi:hypothetical protein